MDIDTPSSPHPPPITTTTTTTGNNNNTSKKTTRELGSCTIKSPPFSYAHLSVAAACPSSSYSDLDALQVRAYCSAALRQFLGDTGAAIAIDILSVQGRDCWVRAPRPDLGAFAAAITAFAGISRDGSTLLLQLQACGDWLGALLGRTDEHKLWVS
ncbi:hypothetical protein B0T17DRAFT_485130 [Bombardia bombarda]|uniref:Ribonucleases P/MRP subunit Pop8-like domain-containing protein n=1 Tax=Bombardia bombarda TaxID=252184 RepID=A0AA39XK49_9PEZI|nr:hypothetical protein B0T17DRAFT_485130 [Bombardia bombarda]